VAVILERRQHAKERGAKCHAMVAGHGVASSGTLFPAVPNSPKWHQHAIGLSLRGASCEASDIDLVFGHGRGDVGLDQLELAALAGTFTNNTPYFSCLSGYTGVAAATSGLYSVAAPLLDSPAAISSPSLALIGLNRIGPFRQTHTKPPTSLTS